MKLWSRSARQGAFSQPLMFWTMNTVPSNVFNWKFVPDTARNTATLKRIPPAEYLPPISNASTVSRIELQVSDEGLRAARACERQGRCLQRRAVEVDPPAL